MYLNIKCHGLPLGCECKNSFWHQLQQHVKIKDTYILNCTKSPIIHKVQQTLTDIDRVRTKLKRSRHVHLIIVSKTLSYNFILITSRLLFSIIKRNLEIIVIYLSIYLRERSELMTWKLWWFLWNYYTWSQNAYNKQFLKIYNNLIYLYFAGILIDILKTSKPL